MKNLIYKYQNQIIIVFIFLFIFCFSLLTYRASFAFIDNSDSHWIGVLAHFAQSGDIYSIPSHTSAIKIPIVILFNKILGFNVFSYSAINLFIMLCMIIPSLFVIYNFTKSENFEARIFKFIIFGLIVTGSTYFFMNSAMTSLRNIEMGVVIMIYYMEIYLLTNEISKNRFWWIICLISFLVFTITITDELNLILLLSPLAILLTIYKLQNLKLKRLLEIFIANLIPGGVSFVLLSGLLNKFNIFIHINPNSPLIFNNFENIGLILKNTFGGIFDMFGSGDFANMHISIASLTNITFFLISIFSFIVLLKFSLKFLRSTKIDLDKSQLFLFFLSISVIFNVIAYVVFDFSVNEGTGRYLIWIVIATATFAGIKSFMKFENLRGYESSLLIFVLFVLFLLNVYYDSKYLKSIYPDLNYYKQIDKIISENNSKLAIGGYWDSFNTSFNTQTHIEVAPYTQCKPYTYTSLASMYKYNPDLIIINRVRDETWVNCNDVDIQNLFGTPTKKYQFGNDEIWVIAK